MKKIILLMFIIIINLNFILFAEAIRNKGINYSLSAGIEYAGWKDNFVNPNSGTQFYFPLGFTLKFFNSKGYTSLHISTGIVSSTKNKNNTQFTFTSLRDTAVEFKSVSKWITLIQVYNFATGAQTLNTEEREAEAKRFLVPVNDHGQGFYSSWNWSVFFINRNYIQWGMGVRLQGYLFLLPFIPLPIFSSTLTPEEGSNISIFPAATSGIYTFIDWKQKNNFFFVDISFKGRGKDELYNNENDKSLGELTDIGSGMEFVFIYIYDRYYSQFLFSISYEFANKDDYLLNDYTPEGIYNIIYTEFGYKWFFPNKIYFLSLGVEYRDIEVILDQEFKGYLYLKPSFMYTYLFKNKKLSISIGGGINYYIDYESARDISGDLTDVVYSGFFIKANIKLLSI